MKKFILTMMTLMVMLFSLTGCTNEKTNIDDEKLSIVTTIFPVYDWVKNVLGEQIENYELTMLLDTGVDLHSYQPTAEDILKISNCDLFIYVGGESDEWVEDALAESTNESLIAINLLEILGENAKEEELVEGMEGEEEEGEDDEEEPEYDEHIWLSLKNAKVLVDSIIDNICKIDSSNSNIYKENAEAYKTRLEELDAEYEKVTSEATIKTVLFGDRFPFRYLVDDYELDYYAAFIGCSAETEASFETIKFLADKVDELNLNKVITLEGSDKKIAETIINSTANKNQTIVTFDSMQSITAKNLKEGADYIIIMENNLEALKEALK